ncbi:MAG: putative porin [Steroidobacteraceae bacterium]|nr:putative porin [Steroidobacteraceae bacterium]
MKSTVLATAVAAVLTLSAADASAQTKGAATKAEVQSIQSQMQALAERLSRLEAANAELKTQNSDLQALADRREAEMDYLKSQTKELREEGAVASNEIAKVKGADWATKIKGRGDVRYRSENIWTERVIAATGTDPAYVDDAADRYRHRIRARLGFDFKATDNVKGTLLFATGADDPRSSNQTLGGSGTRKSIGLDMAYVDWKFMQGGNLLLGKQVNPIFKPGQSLFYDGDFNPEGGAVKIDRGMFFGTAYGWWFSEQHAADPKGENSDANVFGLQAGMKFPLLGGETVVAANYYECGACQGNSPLYNNNANGNSTFRIGSSTTNLLTYGYDIFEVGAQMGVTMANLPVTFWANYARNLADDVEYDTAYAIGAMVGKASDARTWEAGLFYQEIDKDALFAQWIDSDFGDGKTDSEGLVFKAGYAPVKNFTMNATYFMNTLNKDAELDLDYDRLQVDLNYKF